jgi:hypothetical protein
MTTPLGQLSFEDKLEFWENQQPDTEAESNNVEVQQVPEIGLFNLKNWICF